MQNRESYTVNDVLGVTKGHSPNIEHVRLHKHPTDQRAATLHVRVVLVLVLVLRRSNALALIGSHNATKER